MIATAEEGPALTVATEEETFSMQDAYLPAARLALKENLDKQAMKAHRRGNKSI